MLCYIYIYRYCGKCKVHRKGLMNTSIYKLPDILLIHLKRFQITGRWREKINTRIIFPLVGLDLSKYVFHPTVGSSSGEESGMREPGDTNGIREKSALDAEENQQYIYGIVRGLRVPVGRKWIRKRRRRMNML